MFNPKDKVPMTTCLARVLDFNTNEISVRDYDVPTEEWLDSQLASIDEEIASVDSYLCFLKSRKHYCTQCKKLHEKSKKYKNKGENNGK